MYQKGLPSPTYRWDVNVHGELYALQQPEYASATQLASLSDLQFEAGQVTCET